MNKEFLEKRLIEIRNEMEVLKAHYAKLEGHLAECGHWMQKCMENENNNESMEGESNGEVDNQSQELPA
jgi:hypothetical protein